MLIAYGLSFSALIFAPPLTPWLAYGIAADCMHFIMKGRVAIIVHLRNGRTLRVRSLGFHTAIGKMGPYQPAGSQRHHQGRC